MRFITYIQGKYIKPSRGQWKYIKMLILYMTWHKNHFKTDWDKLITYVIPLKQSQNLRNQVVDNKLYVY